MPNNIYCGNSKEMLNGIVASGISMSPLSFAALILLISANAATIIERMEINMPVPILCRKVIPRSFPVKFLAIGTKMRSYTGNSRIIDRLIKPCKLAAGISKCFPIFLSIVAPCFVKNVEDCATTTPNIKHDIQIGDSPRIAFTSSTS
jgi:hypothetical protein